MNQYRMEIDPEIQLLAREEATERVQNIERNLLAVESGSTDPEAINELFRDAHSIESAAAMLGWSNVASIAHQMEDRFDQCRDGDQVLTEVIAEMLASLDEMRRAIRSDEVESGVPNVPPEVPGVLPDVPDAPPGVPASAGSNKYPAGAAGGATPRGAEARGFAPEKPIRVLATKVDRMLDAVGETALNHNRLAHVLRERVPDGARDEAEQQLDMGNRMLSELHDSVIGMRTLPLSSITAPFPRAVRDIAVAEGKQVELRMSGTDTQLDRSILEGLAEQINHLLRNAVAHGIESPDQREAKGKARRGAIELRAEQRGGMVAIEISDDGGGVPAEVLAKADGAESLTELLAEPGFSTAGEVNRVAGRGVGLDAVKKHVEVLGGSLDIRSRPAGGTEVILLLPLTLAVMRVLLCERAGQPFGLPLTSVREVVDASETVSLGGRRALDLNGDATQLEDLAVALGAIAPELPRTAQAMVVEAGGRSIALSCDAVLGDQEVVVKSLGPLLAGATSYLGAAILGDGSVALILDPNQLLRGHAAPAQRRATGETSAVGVGRKPTPPDERAETPRILVVDDQIAARQLQRSILESAGYRVQTACDGREALDRLAQNGVDMVMTDVEMPKMDGFELLRAIRGDNERASLPVVMVTGLGTDAQRRRGADAGADAYIVKEEYDQRKLLDVVSNLVGI